MTKMTLFAAVVFGVLPMSGRVLAQGADEAAKLKREVELLKREAEVLKRENAVLAKENELLKAGGAAAGKPKPEGLPKTTHDGVDYEFVGIKRDGNRATLTVAITSQQGDKNLYHIARLN